MTPRLRRWDDDALRSYAMEMGFARLLQQKVPVTHALLGALAVLFIAGIFFSDLWVAPRFGAPEESVEAMVVVGAKLNAEISAGAYWRLLTHTFLHGSWLHLFFNGYALLVLGSIVERLFGSRRFVIIYGGAALAGAFSSYFFNDVASVGASGAIFGVFGAAIVFGFKHRASLPPRIGKALTTRLLPWLLLSLAFGLLPMIDNAAHFGGLAMGSLLALGFGTPWKREPSPLVMRLQLVLAALLVAATLASFAFGLRHARDCVSSADAWKRCQSSLREP
jgi:rhomboid protease GluP